jgi:hypothetical protein
VRCAETADHLAKEGFAGMALHDTLALAWLSLPAAFTLTESPLRAGKALFCQAVSKIGPADGAQNRLVKPLNVIAGD